MTLSIMALNVECCYADSRDLYYYTECLYGECRYGECRGAFVKHLAPTDDQGPLV